jgi:hypothetical protein
MDELPRLLMASGPLYPEFIMVSTRTKNQLISTYFIGLPNERFALAFGNFERVKESDLPKLIDVVHVADQTKHPRRSVSKPHAD